MKDKVCYSDFGAAGDGIANDFYAVRAAHAYANENGLSVHAERGKSIALLRVAVTIRSPL